MTVFSAPAFDDHQQVTFVTDRATGLRAIIALHRLRPIAGGGIRMQPYASERDGLHDALRLSRAMTFKWALAELPPGGGKTVVIGDPQTMKTPALLHALARAIDRLGGIYIAGSDVGTSSEDMRTMQQVTKHVRGAHPDHGDSAEATAYGVMQGIRAAVLWSMAREDLRGVRVAIQGVGHVGESLCALLTAAGAKVIVADIDRSRAERVSALHGAASTSVASLLESECDVVAPCALGGVFDDTTVAALKASIVCGAANNQLVDERHGQMLHERGILFVPDYVANAGGIINGIAEAKNYDRARVWRQLDRIHDRCLHIFERARYDRTSSLQAACAIARQRIDGGH